MAAEVKAKDLIVKVIPSKIANDFVRKTHYSGKVVPNSNLHFGVFLGKVLHGVMSYGPPMSKQRVIGLVSTGAGYKENWNSMLELNRMAFDEKLPKNSESRALAVSFRLIRKNAPHIKWILSFSDGTASGDGTIYRAAGFLLTDIKPNKSIIVMPDGYRVAGITLQKDYAARKRLYQKYGIALETGASISNLLKVGRYAKGYQLRYIKLLDTSCKVTCAILPYEAIDEAGAGMLRGERITRKERQGQ